MKKFKFVLHRFIFVLKLAHLMLNIDKIRATAKYYLIFNFFFSSMSEDLKDFLKGKPVQIKNAVMMLNEMFPPPKAPQYKVTSQTGPPNNPTFSMVCCIQDENFSGEGMGIFLLLVIQSIFFQKVLCRTELGRGKYFSQKLKLFRHSF